jgi:hypothetical protein
MSEEYEELEGLTAADFQAAIDELGPADGTEAKGEAIIDLAVQIALRRRAEEAHGRPFRFLGETLIQETA